MRAEELGRTSNKVAFTYFFFDIPLGAEQAVLNKHNLIAQNPSRKN